MGTGEVWRGEGGAREGRKEKESKEEGRGGGGEKE